MQTLLNKNEHDKKFREVMYMLALKKKKQNEEHDYDDPRVKRNCVFGCS